MKKLTASLVAAVLLLVSVSMATSVTAAEKNSSTISAGGHRVNVVVNISTQKMTVFKDGKLLYLWVVSTGTPDHPTPIVTNARFTWRQHGWVESNIYKRGMMKDPIYFSKDGDAVHGTPAVAQLGRRASHGCIRLHPANSDKLNALADEVGMKNMTITVTPGGAPSGTRLQASN